MGAFLILLLIIIICWYIMRIQRKIGEFKIFIPIFMWVKKFFSDGFDDTSTVMKITTKTNTTTTYKVKSKAPLV
ncbi:MAG: hypothetical protein IKH78_02155 [Ruminococcus sp.]|nr:hypothetical protein [Ruminococcus sp.]